MPRKKKTDMTTEQPESKPTESATVVVDYRGSVGTSPGQAAVPHTSSPWILMWPEQGVMEMPLYPGANVIKRDIWNLYSAKLGVLKSAIVKGWVREITELPDEYALTNEDNGLIARSVSEEGLNWILKTETRGANRDQVVSAVKRRAGARCVAFAPQAFANFGGGMDRELTRRHGGETKSPTAAMG